MFFTVTKTFILDHKINTFFTTLMWSLCIINKISTTADFLRYFFSCLVRCIFSRLNRFYKKLKQLKNICSKVLTVTTNCFLNLFPIYPFNSKNLNISQSNSKQSIRPFLISLYLYSKMCCVYVTAIQIVLIKNVNYTMLLSPRHIWN